jgi:UDPglucose 6-dehydrogenase
MRVVMIGSGYVGLVSGACFADCGHQVACIDKDGEKIACLKRGEIPIFEPGLDSYLGRWVGYRRTWVSLIGSLRSSRNLFTFKNVFLNPSL